MRKNSFFYSFLPFFFNEFASITLKTTPNFTNFTQHAQAASKIGAIDNVALLQNNTIVQRSEYDAYGKADVRLTGDLDGDGSVEALATEDDYVLFVAADNSQPGDANYNWHCDLYNDRHRWMQAYLQKWHAPGGFQK